VLDRACPNGIFGDLLDPLNDVFLPMRFDDAREVGLVVRLRLRQHLHAAPLQVIQSQEHHPMPPQNPFQLLDLVVGPTQLHLEIEIIHFTGPAVSVPFQDLSGHPRQIRAEKVRRGFIPRVP